MFHKKKITLAKSIIFEYLEDFLNEIIELKYVTIEVGMGVDRYHPTENLQLDFLKRLDKLKNILDEHEIPVENIRLHLPVGYRYDLVDKVWSNEKQELYDSFEVIKQFINKALSLGFRYFVMHSPWICIKTIDKRNDKTYESSYEDTLNDYCKKLKKLNKKVLSKEGILFMEFLGHKDEMIHENDEMYKLFRGSNMHQYKRILKKSGVEPLLDTGIFDSINEFKIAKEDLQKEGFPVRAIHIQGNAKKSHHMHISDKDFEKIIDDFAGVIIDEGFYKYKFKEGELNEKLNNGEDLKHLMMSPEEQIKVVEKNLEKLKDKRKANLMFKLKKVVDKDLK